MSKLEESLAGVLHMMSMADPPWPFPAPVRQLHPDWCCEHRKPEHKAAVHRRPRHWYHIGDDPAQCVSCERGKQNHEYAKGRDWAIDFAYPTLKVAVECEGIVYAKKGQQVGRHQTAVGFQGDLDKYGWLQEHGWTVVRVSQRMVTSGAALNLIQSALEQASALKAATA